MQLAGRQFDTSIIDHGWETPQESFLKPQSTHVLTRLSHVEIPAHQALTLASGETRVEQRIPGKSGFSGSSWSKSLRSLFAHGTWELLNASVAHRHPSQLLFCFPTWYEKDLGKREMKVSAATLSQAPSSASLQPTGWAWGMAGSPLGDPSTRPEARAYLPLLDD